MMFFWDREEYFKYKSKGNVRGKILSKFDCLKS